MANGGMAVQIESFEGEVLGLSLPEQITVEVVETDPANVQSTTANTVPVTLAVGGSDRTGYRLPVCLQAFRTLSDAVPAISQGSDELE